MKREKDSFITLSDAMKCVKGAAKQNIKLLARRPGLSNTIRWIDNERG